MLEAAKELLLLLYGYTIIQKQSYFNKIVLG